MQTLEDMAGEMAEYWPAPQAVQAVSAMDPVAVMNLPATQLMHALATVLPAVDSQVPAAQSLQSPTWSWPVRSSHLPAGQAVHWVSAVAPAVPPYFPAPQEMQFAAESRPSTEE